MDQGLWINLADAGICKKEWKDEMYRTVLS